MIIPKKIIPGDTVYLVSPAKAIEAHYIDSAKLYWENLGCKVITGKHAYGNFNYFSGQLSERLSDFQDAIDNPEVKAIICNRGGYGCIHLSERLSWANFLREPKWLIGFSDVTVLHLKAFQLGVASIHGTMPLNYSTNTTESFSSLEQIIRDASHELYWNTNQNNILGHSKGTLIGGNLSILYSLLSTPLAPKGDNFILFIEDVGEQWYHLDRMMYSLALSGFLNRINGLIIGGFTGMKDTEIPSGLNLYNCILPHFQFRKIPIAFDAPIGHQDDNRSVVQGIFSELHVTAEGVSLRQHLV